MTLTTPTRRTSTIDVTQHDITYSLRHMSDVMLCDVIGRNAAGRDGQAQYSQGHVKFKCFRTRHIPPTIETRICYWFSH